MKIDSNRIGDLIENLIENGDELIALLQNREWMAVAYPSIIEGEAVVVAERECGGGEEITNIADFLASIIPTSCGEKWDEDEAVNARIWVKALRVGAEMLEKSIPPEFQ